MRSEMLRVLAQEGLSQRKSSRSQYESEVSQPSRSISEKKDRDDADMVLNDIPRQ